MTERVATPIQPRRPPPPPRPTPSAVAAPAVVGPTVPGRSQSARTLPQPPPRTTTTQQQSHPPQSSPRTLPSAPARQQSSPRVLPTAPPRPRVTLLATTSSTNPEQPPMHQRRKSAGSATTVTTGTPTIQKRRPPAPPSTPKPPIPSTAAAVSAAASAKTTPPPIPTAPKPAIRKMHVPPSSAPPPAPPQQPPQQQQLVRRRSLSFGDEAFALALATSSNPAMRSQDDTALLRQGGAEDGDDAGLGAIAGKVGSALVSFGSSLFKKSRDDSGLPPRTSPPAQPAILEFRSDTRDLVEAIRAMSNAVWDAPDLVDNWSSRPLPSEQWNEAPSPSEQLQLLPLVDPEAAKAGWHIESSWNSVTHTTELGTATSLFVLEADTDFPWYAEFIAKAPHNNFVSTGDAAAPFIVTIEQNTRPGGARRAIVRSKKDDRRVLLPCADSRKALEAMIPQLKEAKLTKVKSEALVTELVNFEARNLRPTAKFGLLYVRPGLREENTIYGEQGGSAAYDEFLDFLGERVQLQGWTKYRGGLDVKSNNTGTHSVYAEFQNYEIMFHVATMLPFVEVDVQKVDRKRHIGNDVSVVVFKDKQDASDTFPPQILTSHFIHCVIVISPELDSQGRTTHYHIAIANKPGVPPYPPFISADARYEKCPAFRNIILAKLLNGGRAALASAEFSSLVTARKGQLNGLIEDSLK